VDSREDARASFRAASAFAPPSPPPNARLAFVTLFPLSTNEFALTGRANTADVPTTPIRPSSATALRGCVAAVIAASTRRESHGTRAARLEVSLMSRKFRFWDLTLFAVWNGPKEYFHLT